MDSISYLHGLEKRKMSCPFWEQHQGSSVYNLQPGHNIVYANPAPIISKFVIRLSWFIQRKRHYVQFNIILSPDLLLIINICDPYLSLQGNGRPTDHGHFFQSIYSLYLSLDTFARQRKLTMCFVMCVCLSVRLEELGSNRNNFHDILYFKAPKICMQILV